MENFIMTGGDQVHVALLTAAADRKENLGGAKLPRRKRVEIQKILQLNQN